MPALALFFYNHAHNSDGLCIKQKRRRVCLTPVSLQLGTDAQVVSFFFLKASIQSMSCLLYELLTTTFHRLGQVACTALPGRPFVCVDPQTPCPSVCESGFKICGLQRGGDGRLLIGPDGLPLPNCFPADQAGTMCDQTNIRPLPANFTGGNGLGRWDYVRLNGTSDGQSDVGIIAEIGSEPFAGAPAFFGGNGTDPTVVVKVRNNSPSTLFILCHEFSTVRRFRSC